MKPILYSFRRCPYAMRARLAIYAAKQQCELREVVLKDKPQALLDASPKATVPVLLDGERLIDESVDIMRWAISRSAISGWSIDELDDALVAQNDGEFKIYLDRYKYFDRFPEQPQQVYFDQASAFLKQCEQALIFNSHGDAFLKTAHYSALDAAILPFVRQFALVDKARFEQLNLPKLHVWLSAFLESERFQSIMHKYQPWSPQQDQPVLFGI